MKIHELTEEQDSKLTREVVMVVEETAESAIEVIVSQEALAAVDYSLPSSYELEIMAAELVQYLTQYHSAVAGGKAARQEEDHQKAELFAKAVRFSRSAIALIQYNHPGVKARADEIMEAQAENIRARRASMSLASKNGRE